MPAVVLIGDSAVALGDLADEVCSAVGVGLAVVVRGGNRYQLSVGVILEALCVFLYERDVGK